MTTHDRSDQAAGGSAPEQDSAFILKCLGELCSSQAEFPIKVEGTHTLPYSSQILSIGGGEVLVLKLLRPLPHELMTNALFEMVFSAGEQRYQGLITFQKREAYLTYRFTVPSALVLSDRRRCKRYPFRPRENVDVLAQDASVPGHGMSGPLVNLSTGGLAFRVDRIVNLDDGLRIPATKAFFEPVKVLSRIKIRNLPKVPLLEARGSICHVEEVSDGVLLGVEFLDLGAEDASRLGLVLDIREKSFRSPASPVSTEPRAGRAGAKKEVADPAGVDPVPAPPVKVPAPVLRTLQRRCRDLRLVGADNPETAKVRDRLIGSGYFRTLDYPSPDRLGRAPVPGPDLAGALVVLLGPAQESLKEIRSAQQSLGAWQGFPAVFLAASPDPVAVLAEEASWRLLPLSAVADGSLLEALDQLTRIL